MIVGVAPSCWKWLTNEDISECKAADIADHNEQLFDNAVKPYLGMSVKGWVYYQGEKYASPSLAPAGPFFSRRRQRALLESARAAAPKKAASGEAACADPAVSVSVGPCSNCGGLHGNSGTKTQPPSGYACMMYGTELWRPLVSFSLGASETIFWCSVSRARACVQAHRYQESLTETTICGVQLLHTIFRA